MWKQCGKCPDDSQSFPLTRLFAAVHHFPILALAQRAFCPSAISLAAITGVPGRRYFEEWVAFSLGLQAGRVCL
jgi:hypothetical protein